VIRHSAEHDGGRREAPFPNAQVDVGRTDHSEIQYDFLVEHLLARRSRKHRKRNLQILAEKSDFVREVMGREEAKAFQARGENSAFAARGHPRASRSIFRHGEFIACAASPRATSDRSFQHHRVRGRVLAWRREQSDAQRIYGTAFATEKELRTSPESKRRNAATTDGSGGTGLFTDSIAPGSPFCLPGA
jgi:threonyl-tRNA synthetase